jgi:hypothetical protein
VSCQFIEKNDDGTDGDDSDVDDTMLHDRFVQSRFRKIFRMVVWKITWRDRMLRVFRVPLSGLVPTDRHHLVNEFLSAFPSVREGDTVKFIFFEDGERVEMLHLEKTVFSMRSADMWVALQSIWLDRGTSTPELRASLLAGLSNQLLIHGFIERADASVEEDNRVQSCQTVDGVPCSPKISRGRFVRSREELRMELETASAKLKTSQWEAFLAGAVVGALVVVLLILAVSAPFHETRWNYTAMSTTTMCLLPPLIFITQPSLRRMWRVREFVSSSAADGVATSRQNNLRSSEAPGACVSEMRKHDS